MKTYNDFFLLYSDIYHQFYMSNTEEFRQMNDFTELSDFNEIYFKRKFIGIMCESLSVYLLNLTKIRKLCKRIWRTMDSSRLYPCDLDL